MAPVGRLDIEVREKRYPAVDRAAPRVALSDLRFAVEGGEFVCVVGPSGCGKTTLLNIVAGLDRDFDGRVDHGASRAGERPLVGYVFQNARLLPWRTVVENVELVLDDARRRSGIVGQLLAATGLDDARHVYATRLSAGMGRRVALARAFAIEPELLLMDEPLASLDAPTAQHLRGLLLDVWAARPTTVLFVTHDLREAIQLADRIVFLSAAPGSVTADVAVDLPRGGRDEGAIEAFRAALLGDNPALLPTAPEG